MLDWDHFNLKTIDYINTVNRIWVDEYKVDGFRFDAMYMIGWDMQQQEYGIPGWSTALYNYDSTIYQIAEHLPSIHGSSIIPIYPLDGTIAFTIDF